MEFAIHLHSYKSGIRESLQCLFTIIAAKNLSEIIEVEEETPLAVATAILATPDHSKQAKAKSSSPQKGHSTIDMEQDGLEDSQNKTKDHPRPPTCWRREAWRTESQIELQSGTQRAARKKMIGRRWWLFASCSTFNVLLFFSFF